LRDVRDLCELYQVADPQRDHLMALAREGRQQGWWQSYDLQRFSIYVGLEDDTTRMNIFESMLVPGLLQTLITLMPSLNQACCNPPRRRLSKPSKCGLPGRICSPGLIRRTSW
jgi:hypothetical protein